MKTLKKRIGAMIMSLLMVLSLCTVMPQMKTLAAEYSMIFPVNNGCKIAYYQGLDPNYSTESEHDGIDIHSSGDDLIYAAKSGAVVGLFDGCKHEDEGPSHGGSKGKYGEAGNYIKIKGDDGLYYWYYHLKQYTQLVKKGDKVTAGQAIATMGSSGMSYGKHLHFRVTKEEGYYSSAVIVNPVGKYNGEVNYSNGPYNAGNSTTSYNYQIISGTYYMKNKSTGTYLYLPGSDTNGSGMSLGAKKDANAYKMQFNAITSGNANNGHYIVPKGCTRVVNPYADSPTNGTKITLYDKSTDGTQYWCAESVGTNEYILHLKYNQNLVLTGSGTSVTVATNSNAASQTWVFENADVIEPGDVLQGANEALACQHAMEILYNNEGSYTTVTKNDNNALSIGKLQWHATRALNLLKDIIALNPSNAKSILGTSLYDEITTSTSWSNRIASDEEAALLKTLLATSESKTVQDQTGANDVSGYISAGVKLGITDVAVLVYYADMRNQGANFANDMAEIAKEKAGSYSYITLSIIHEVALENQNDHFKEQFWNGIKNRRIKTYEYCLQFSTTTSYNYQLISGTYYLKNKSTGTYLYLLGSDTNGSAMSLGAKKDANAYKMQFNAITSGNANNGHYIVPKGCTRVVNPYADSPTNGTKITLYDKSTDGTQYWCAESVGTNEYILHLKYNQNLVLTGSGTSVTVATNSNAANQIWVLEESDVLYGDANRDGKVTIADAAAIFQTLANSDKYLLTEQGHKNADCYNPGSGITAADAIAIQKLDAKLIDVLPVTE